MFPWKVNTLHVWKESIYPIPLTLGYFSKMSISPSISRAQFLSLTFLYLFISTQFISTLRLKSLYLTWRRRHDNVALTTTMMMTKTMIEILFCLFPLLSFSVGCWDVVLFCDIVDLANCDGATERRRDGRKDGRTDTTSYRDFEAHLKKAMDGKEERWE